MASTNFTIDQFQLFHDWSQAWTAKINNQEVTCVGLALVDGHLQGLVSPTQVGSLAKNNLNPQDGWIPANSIEGFQGYYQPAMYDQSQQRQQTMRESVSPGATAARSNSP